MWIHNLYILKCVKINPQKYLFKVSPDNSQFQQIIDSGICCPLIKSNLPTIKKKRECPCDTSKYILKNQTSY